MNKSRMKMMVSTCHSTAEPSRLTKMARVVTLGLLVLLPFSADAQRLLTFDR